MTRKRLPLLLLALAVLVISITGPAFSQRFENLRAENNEVLFMSSAQVDVVTPNAVTITVTAFMCNGEMIAPPQDFPVMAGEAGRPFVIRFGPVLQSAFTPQPLRWRFSSGGETLETVTLGRVAGMCPAGAVALPHSLDNASNLLQAMVGNQVSYDNNPSTLANFIDNARPENNGFLFLTATRADRLREAPMTITVRQTTCDGDIITDEADVMIPADQGLPLVIQSLRGPDPDGVLPAPLVWEWVSGFTYDTTTTGMDGRSPFKCPE